MSPHPRFIKRPNRSPEQRRADVFDADLYGLICIAEAAADGIGKKEYAKWHAVRLRLLQARLLVREMMHPDDRKDTA